MPTPSEIKSDVIKLYKEQKDKINKETLSGIIAKSGRDENIEKAIDVVLSKEEVTHLTRVDYELSQLRMEL